jgi:hypothetical protein
VAWLRAACDDSVNRIIALATPQKRRAAALRKTAMS